jgi:isochorismate hydrolase
MLVGNRSSPPSRRSTARSSSSETRQAPSSRLDELGATTLVLCGAFAGPGLEATARHAADLGYQVFVVADACRAVDTADLRGRLWPAEDVRALALARLRGETATIVDVATTLRAAATAKARQRRASGRA